MESSVKYCNYDIEQIIDTGNSVKVYAQFCEGEYFQTNDPITNEQKTEYRRGIIFKDPILFLDRNPVPLEEINAILLNELNNCKGDRIVIPEQA